LKPIVDQGIALFIVQSHAVRIDATGNVMVTPECAAVSSVKRECATIANKSRSNWNQMSAGPTPKTSNRAITASNS
jgi:hypothetical protein